jgi:ABC-2 type transport system ATP-binding protein
MLEVRQVTKIYPGQRGISGLNLTVNTGEVVALLGPNGAGKTTALKAMMGYIHPDEGEVFWNGISLKDNPHQVKQQVGILIGEPAPYPWLTGYDYLKLYRQLYANISEARIQEVLEQVNLWDRQHLKIKHYSTGMKQRIDLARTLLHEPKLLLLDEPFSGMDIEGRHEGISLLRRLVTETGMSIIISSHLIQDIESLTTHVGIVYHGKWLEAVTATAIKAEFPSLEAYYLHQTGKEKRGA